MTMSSMAQAADLPPRAKPEEVGMSSERLALISNAVNAEIAREQLPGAVLAIARRGKLVYFETLGARDKAAGAPMTTDAIFNIASMTKPMVAVGALQLYEQGKLLMDEPLAKYFPKFADMRVAVMDAKKENIIETVPAVRKITIQDLFRHTSGLIYGGRGTTAVHKLYPEGSGQAAAAMTGAEFVDHLASRPLLYQPGTVWDYGFGLDLLGLVIEQLTEQSLGSYLQQNVWKPLGMTDTGFLIPPDKAGRYAAALPKDPVSGNPQSMTAFTQKTKFECGGGCAASTASDYLRFALMLMNKGKSGDTRILGPKTVEYMLSNQLAPDVKNLIQNGDPTRADYGFGLGLAVRTTPGIVRMMGSVGDFSWPGASGTNWWADPHEELAVVWMAHSPGPIRWKYRQMINALVYQAIVD
ncbi:MAG TPA: serine hydrolase domain-containing protein [Xanthobacteraceae bacterium]